MSKMNESPEQFKWRIIFMSIFNDISLGSEYKEQECAVDANCVFIYARKFFHQEDGHSSHLGQKRSDIRLMIANHKENGTES